MKTSSRRYRRQRNPENPDKKEKPFFNTPGAALQQKSDAFFQPKLAIGSPDDQYEREADAVANRVVSEPGMKGNAVQRKEISALQRKNEPEASSGKEDERKLKEQDVPVKKEEEKPVQKKDDGGKKEEEEKKEQPAAVKKEEEKPVQKKDETVKKEDEDKKSEAAVGGMKKEEEKPPVQKKGESGDTAQAEAGSKMEERLAQRKHKGQPMNGMAQSEMSNAIGADFEGVRIHTDEEAAQMNRDLGAQAFTHGNDVYFGSGKYDPGTNTGKQLLAHELTHVVQQGAAPPVNAPAPATVAHAAPAGVQRLPSTPLPEGVEPDKKSKVAKFNSGDFVIKVKPDKKLKKASKTVAKDGAVTSGSIKAKVKVKKSKGKIISVTITKELTIQTTYGHKADPEATSVYGRGTTEDDQEAGNTSLRFHEGSHGQDYINYVNTNPFPEIVIEEPLTQKEYNVLFKEWKKQVKEYKDDMQTQSKNDTDEVGHTLTEELAGE